MWECVYVVTRTYTHSHTYIHARIQTRYMKDLCVYIWKIWVTSWRRCTSSPMVSHSFMSIRVWVTRMHESCHTCEWVMSHLWRVISKVCHIRSSNTCLSHPYIWVMSHMWMSHDTFFEESCQRYVTLEAPCQCSYRYRYVWGIIHPYGYVWYTLAYRS